MQFRLAEGFCNAIGVMSVCAALAPAPLAAQVFGPNAQAEQLVIPYEAAGPRAPNGDKLAEARRIAAAVVAQDYPAPKLVVDIGSYTGEFLEAFLDQFPDAHGQWTEPVATNQPRAERRLARFGDRVAYKIGCPARDISLECVPPGVDVLISSWLSIHQDLAGIQKFHGNAFAMLRPGGWVAIIDHVGLQPGWEKRMADARTMAAAKGLAASEEGPPIHHPGLRAPAWNEQIGSLKAAGFQDVHILWSRLDTVLMLGRKP